ncbi:MAG TPA: flagellar biosynthetic protein FliR [Gammaproteobacteria bacterium]|nr:flagellar biosynthetic protein FliR [Gammaproteobacteria bacterium]
MITVSSMQLNAWVAAFLWPFMRIGAMLVAAPVFGARMVPVRVRLALALVLALMMAPMVSQDVAAIDPLSAQGLLISAQQLLIGAAMGFILQMAFSAIVIGAQSIAMSMGLGFATAVDPQNGVQVPVIAQYYLTLATLIFLALNGHLLLVQILVDSFQTLPVGVIGLSSAGLWDIVNWGGRMFTGAVLIALTGISALLLINLAFGVMSRAAPQLNIFGVGFPVMMGAGFIVIMVSLPGITPHVSNLMLDAFDLLRSLLAGG